MSTPDAAKPPMETTARAIVAKLRDAGHVAYFADGCVRGAVPKDIDMPRTRGR